MRFILCDAFGNPAEEFNPPMIMYGTEVILRGEQVWIRRRGAAIPNDGRDGKRFFDEVPHDKIYKVHHATSAKVVD